MVHVARVAGRYLREVLVEIDEAGEAIVGQTSCRRFYEPEALPAFFLQLPAGPGPSSSRNAGCRQKEQLVKRGSRAKGLPPDEHRGAAPVKIPKVPIGHERLECGGDTVEC